MRGVTRRLLLLLRDTVGAVGGLLAIPARWLRDFAAREGEPAPRPPSTWVLAAVAVLGTLFVTAVGLAVVRTSTPPAPPYLPVVAMEELPPNVFDHDRGLLFLREDDDVTVLAAPDGRVLQVCTDSGRIEGDDGGVWDLRGHPVAADVALVRHPVRVYEGTVYVNRDVTRSPEGAAPDAVDGDVEPACPAPTAPS